MQKRYYLLILIVFLLAGCARHHSNIPATFQASGIHKSQIRKVSAFTQVNVRGKLNINLHTGYKKPQVILKGDPRDLAQVLVSVGNHTLFLILPKEYPLYGPVDVDIHTNTLNRVHYVGAGRITGSQLHTRSLDLYLANQGMTRLGGTIGLRKLEVIGGGGTQIDGIMSYDLQISIHGSPRVLLNGFARVSKIEVEGAGQLSLFWMKSDTLTIRARKGAKIQLAGVVNRLDVELWGASRFKGRYLRAQRSFVKTHDRSVAQISSVKHQSSLSTDISDIYYYNLPDTRADFMAFDGSTLDMREWTLNERDFTRYNKQFP